VLLLEDPAKIEQGIADGMGTAVSTPQAQTPLPPVLPRRQEQQPLFAAPNQPSSPPNAHGRSGSGDNRAGWSPINFIEQQISKNTTAKTNLKKISSWFDKAKAQFGDMIDGIEQRYVEIL
jgi:hypothetical protein